MGVRLVNYYRSECCWDSVRYLKFEVRHSKRRLILTMNMIGTVHASST